MCVVGAEGVSTRRRALEGKTCPARATHSELAGEGGASPRSGVGSPQSREKDTGVQASHLKGFVLCRGDGGGYRFPGALRSNPHRGTRNHAPCFGCAVSVRGSPISLLRHVAASPACAECVLFARRGCAPRSRPPALTAPRRPSPPPAVPALSPTMATGVIAEWLYKEGEQIKSGSVIARVET